MRICVLLTGRGLHNARHAVAAGDYAMLATFNVWLDGHGLLGYCTRPTLPAFVFLYWMCAVLTGMLKLSNER